MLEVASVHLRTVQRLLAAHLPDREVRAFGSRVRGRSKPYSDLDLVVMGDEPIPDLARAELVADLEESDLPFRVDLLAWRDAPPGLRDIIAREAVPIYAHGRRKSVDTRDRPSRSTQGGQQNGSL